MNLGTSPAFISCMETQKQSEEKLKLQESIRKIQRHLADALQDHQYWGLDQKIQQIQKNLQLTQRI